MQNIPLKNSLNLNNWRIQKSRQTISLKSRARPRFRVTCALPTMSPHDCLVTLLPHASPRSDSPSKLTFARSYWVRTSLSLALLSRNGNQILKKWWNFCSKRFPFITKLIPGDKKKKFQRLSPPNIAFRSRYLFFPPASLFRRLDFLRCLFAKSIRVGSDTLVKSFPAAPVNKNTRQIFDSYLKHQPRTEFELLIPAKVNTVP